MPRSNDTSNARTPKRRRLNDNSFEEILPYSHAAFIPTLEHDEYEYGNGTVSAEEEQVDYNSNYDGNIEASAGRIRDDGSSECCYGMVGSCIPHDTTLLNTLSSCLIFMCDFDILQTSQRLNFPPSFLLPSEHPARSPL